MYYRLFILSLLITAAACNSAPDQVQDEQKKEKKASSDTSDISGIQWKRLNDYIEYHELSAAQNGQDSVYFMETLGIFSGQEQAYAPTRQDSAVEMGYDELTSFLRNQSLFKGKRKVDYLLKVNSELFYFHQPWLLYTIVVTPADKSLATARAIQKNLEALPYVEKVEADSMEVDIFDTLVNDFRRRIYFKAVLKDKTVSMEQAGALAANIRAIKGVEHADFNTIYTGAARSFPVYRVRGK